MSRRTIELLSYPGSSRYCNGCGDPLTEDEWRDLVTLKLGHVTVQLCHDCSYELATKLLDHFYILWGQAAMPADAVEAEREECAKVAEAWAAHYPPDVFPEDSETIDGRSARAMRHAAAMIAKQIRETEATCTQS